MTTKTWTSIERDGAGCIAILRNGSDVATAKTADVSDYILGACNAHDSLLAERDAMKESMARIAGLTADRPEYPELSRHFGEIHGLARTTLKNYRSQTR